MRTKLFLSVLLLAAARLAASPPDSTKTGCNFRIDLSLSGLDLTAQLVPTVSPAPPLPIAEWSVDWQPVDTFPFLNHTFDQLGEHFICAKFDVAGGGSCKVCKAISVFPSPTPGCIDPKLFNSGAGCSTVFEPVCGCDGITYGNFCPAVNYHGVSRWWSGQCGAVGTCQSLDVEFSMAATGTKAKFTDQTTFPDGTPSGWLWIFDNQQASGDQNPGFDFQTPGEHRVCVTVTATKTGSTGVCVSGLCRIVTVGQPPCVDTTLIEPGASCPAVYDPVCGCDGKTYGNSCEAVKYGGVTSYLPGTCASQCVVASWLKPAMDCPMAAAPVCGCDGQTYQNYCLALYHNGVTSWSDGACDFLGADEADGLAVKLFPNPTGQKMTAAFPEGASHSLSIFDATGRLFLKKEDCWGEVELDLTGLPRGLFLVKIADGQRVLTKKMVKTE